MMPSIVVSSNNSIYRMNKKNSPKNFDFDFDFNLGNMRKVQSLIDRGAPLNCESCHPLHSSICDRPLGGTLPYLFCVQLQRPIII